MIIYDLVCEYNHSFEGWFNNADDFGSQKSNGLLSCPVCDTINVHKKLTAPSVTKKSNAGSLFIPSKQSFVASDGSDSGKLADDFEYVEKLLHHVHEFIDDNFEDVGNKFADQAISMHKGESGPANIRGTASKEQLNTMAEQGVKTLAIPAKPIEKKKLN